ncbi:MAG: hypothetical protein ABII88_00010 [Candidatus Omnitrophota bacterium]
MFYPSIRIHDGIARADAASARSKLSRTEIEIKETKLDIERLLLITEALWNILKEEHGYADEDLVKRVNEIDSRDGKLDGKVKPQGPLPCPNCGHNLMKKRPVCIYCGECINIDLFER